MLKINMKSSANLVKGQGVGSCYDEQVKLIKSSKEFEVSENGYGNFDIIHYHTVNPGYFLNRLLKKHRTVGVGYVHFLPNTLEDSLSLPKIFKKVVYSYILKFYNSMDYLVTVNPYFVNEIRKYNVLNPQIVCIPNFVDSDTFYPVEKSECMGVRDKYGIDKNKFVVLGVGQLQTRKGILDFIETAKLLPETQFVWAGGFSFGKISDGYEVIKPIVNNPPKNVKFLGIVNREDMPDIYNMADMMFLPSYDELFPMSILEALCCKKPVLVRDVPLYDSILFDYCPRANTLEGFASIICELEGDRRAYESFSDKAWQCHNLYTKESALKQWTEFYSSIATKKIFSEKWVLTR